MEFSRRLMTKAVSLIIIHIIFLSSLQPVFAAANELEQLINEGITFHNNRNYTLSIKSFQRALDIDPNHEEVKIHLSTAHNNYGKYLAERTDTIGAKREFRLALYHNPENEIARSNLDFKLKAEGVDFKNPMERITEAKRERHISNHLAAVAELREANRYKETVEAYIEMGQIYNVLYLRHLDKKYFADAAIEAFEKAEKINPEDERSLIGRGDVYIAQNAISKGIDFYEAAIQKAPESQVAQDALIGGWLAAIRVAPHMANNHVGLGTAYQIKGDYRQAERSFRRALQIDPNNSYAKDGLAELFENQKQAQVATFIERALKLQEAKDFDQSLSYYIKALNIEPNNPDIHYNIGTAFQAKNDMLRAERAYRKTLELNPNHAEAKAALGMVMENKKEENIAEAFKHAIQLQQRGDYPRAIEVYQKIAVDKPNDDSVFYNIATAYQAMGNFTEAIKYYEQAQAIKADPSYEALISSTRLELANQILGQGIQEQTDGDNKKAIESYQKVLEMVPDNASAWYNLGTAFQSDGRNTEALKAYDKAYGLDPTNQADSLFFSAVILEEERKLVEAVDMYEKYITSQPNGDYFQQSKERQEYIKSFL